VVTFCAQSLCKVAVHTATDFDMQCAQRLLAANMLQVMVGSAAPQVRGGREDRITGLTLPPAFYGLSERNAPPPYDEPSPLERYGFSASYIQLKYYI
jgi:hypothetical protein